MYLQFFLIYLIFAFICQLNPIHSQTVKLAVSFLFAILSVLMHQCCFEDGSWSQVVTYLFKVTRSQVHCTQSQNLWLWCALRCVLHFTYKLYIYSVFIVANKFPQMLASTMFHDVFIYFSASSLSTCVQRNSHVSFCWCTPAVLYPGTCMLSCNFSSHEKNSRRRSFLLTLPIWFLGISSTTTRPVGMV